MNQIGIIGLGTMGASLSRNLAHNNIAVSVFNRTFQVTQDFLAQHEQEGQLQGFENLQDFVGSLESPKKIMLFVTAGPATDAVIDQLIPLLSSNDIIIDGGNSDYHDTIIRTQKLAQHQIEFVGCGVSGGEKGALEGPSLMPGGSIAAITNILPILMKIAAKDFKGEPCIYPFEGIGIGNFIKTAHNGIEYAIMQAYSDAYELLRKIYQLKPQGIAEVFRKFKNSDFDGFLLDTAIQVLEKTDTFNPDQSLIDYISDEAGSKGTGAWTSIEALELGVPVPSITAALHARQLSAHKDVRQLKQSMFIKPFPDSQPKLPLDVFVAKLEQSLWVTVLASYMQGIHLLETAIHQHNWTAPTHEILRVWQGGCIIRSQMLSILPTSDNLDKIQPKLDPSLTSLKDVLSESYAFAVSVPVLSASFDYLNYQFTGNLPTNLIQGMRDAFGAHTYQRTDREGSFTEKWD
jgi:6-phosphogluconate dehydrogenase